MSDASTFLARVTSALEKAEVPYMLAGSFASSHHGAPRTTQDIDIVVDPTFASLDRLLEALTGDDVYVDADVARDEFKRRGQFNVIDGVTAGVCTRETPPLHRPSASAGLPCTPLMDELRTSRRRA